MPTFSYAGDLYRFVGSGKGSSGEVRSQLYVAFDAGYITDTELATFKTAAEHCSGKIQRLADYLRSPKNR